MKVSELGRRTMSTPTYSALNKEKQNKQQDDPFPKAGKFPDSQTLMGGPQYKSLEALSPSDKAFYAKKKLETVMMRSFGRYHENGNNPNA